VPSSARKQPFPECHPFSEMEGGEGLHFHKASTGGVGKGKGVGRGGEGKSRRVTDKERCLF